MDKNVEFTDSNNLCDNDVNLNNKNNLDVSFTKGSENEKIAQDNIQNDGTESRNEKINKKIIKQISSREELEKVKLRKTQANTFEKYVNDTGIASAFQLIFSEIITKKIPIEDHYTYTAGRLRQIGRELDEINLKNKNTDYNIIK
jgi:protein-tyrosine phosphatase